MCPCVYCVCENLLHACEWYVIDNRREPKVVWAKFSTLSKADFDIRLLCMLPYLSKLDCLTLTSFTRHFMHGKLNEEVCPENSLSQHCRSISKSKRKFNYSHTIAASLYTYRLNLASRGVEKTAI